MDPFTALLTPGGIQITAGALLGAVVIAIFTGLLVPYRTHNRELKAAVAVGEQHRLASERKDIAIGKLLDQNSRLLAGVRIADKFYGDFVTPIDEATRPPNRDPDVAV